MMLTIFHLQNDMATVKIKIPITDFWNGGGKLEKGRMLYSQPLSGKYHTLGQYDEYIPESNMVFINNSKFTKNRQPMDVSLVFIEVDAQPIYK